MADIDVNRTTLLEEVFNEIEYLEKSTSQKDKKEFLKDDFSLGRNIQSNTKMQKKKQQHEKQLACSKILQEVQSLIHEGLTDSSDDEDNKYFEERKYNECGKVLKNLIKQKIVTKDYMTKKAPQIEDTWTNTQKTNEKLKMHLEKVNDNNASKENVVCSLLGMRIINPLISSTTLKEKMIGRISVGTSRIKKFIESPNSKEINWVTGGAIVSKITKTSQKGNKYCVWHVTDLNGDLKTICVFLFGSAYKEYWKTSLGSVVGILNPIVMDSKEKSEATLRVDNAQKILLIGISKDYGICKSKKKNGENCSFFVNTAKCDFCTFHIKKEYNRACRRSDLQPPKIGRSLDNLRSKVLGKNQFFNEGKTYSTVIGKKSIKQVKKDEQRIKTLSQSISLNISQTQAKKDIDILNKLSGNINLNKAIIPTSLQQNNIDLNFTVSKKDKSIAKANALKYIQQFGPIKKISDKKSKKTPEQIASLKRKLEIEEKVVKKKIKKSETNDMVNPLKEKFKRHGITDEFFKLMKSEVQNNDLLKIAEGEEREKYFNKLEMKEKIEEKMASTFKVECKAVRCLKCNYKSFSASDLCKKEKHPLKIINAIKRFWKCGDCSARTVCLELVPLNSCKICGSSKWERASMMPEKKGPNLVVEPLSIRGHEEKFIGATMKNGNLNLLVPEES